MSQRFDVRAAISLTLALRCVVILGLLLFPLPFAGSLAGDAVIHLVFGEHAAKGGWFEFNLGDQTGGETSPGYLLIITLLYHVLPLSLVPYFLSLLSVCTWFALLCVIYRLFLKVLASEALAFSGMVLCGFLPGSAQNSVMGMENALFALMLYIFLLQLVARGFFDRLLRSRTEAGLGFVGGVLALFRPEMVAIGGTIFAARAVFLPREIGFRGRGARFLVSCSAFVLAFGAGVGWYYLVASSFPYSAGVARSQLSANEGFDLGIFSFNPRFAVRLCYYFPFVLLAVWAARRLWLPKPLVRAPHTPFLRVIVILCTVSFVLFSTVFPSVHLARYTIYFWPLLILLSLWALKHQKLHRFWGAAGVLLVACLYSYEYWLRWNLAPGLPLAAVSAGPEKRQEYTDAFLSSIQQTRVPVVVAAVEVQERYFFDERVIVRSLDGIVDRQLNDFVRSDGYFDHIGYLRSRSVDILLELASFNRNPDSWSLVSLATVPIGSSISHEGLTFTRLSHRAFRVSPSE
jgi:hypothetical protein